MRKTDLLQQQRRFHAFVKCDPGRGGHPLRVPVLRASTFSNIKLLTIFVYFQRRLQLVLILSDEFNIQLSLLTSVNSGPSWWLLKAPLRVSIFGWGSRALWRLACVGIDLLTGCSMKNR